MDLDTVHNSSRDLFNNDHTHNSNNTSVDYKTFLHSLYAQLEHLQKDSIEKSYIIKGLISENTALRSAVNVNVDENINLCKAKVCVCSVDTDSNTDLLIQFEESRSESDLEVTFASDDKNASDADVDSDVDITCNRKKAYKRIGVNAEEISIIDSTEHEDEDDDIYKSSFPDMAKDDDDPLAPWERHSTGFGSKMLRKMGYGGKGLGKTEDGIVHPITIEKKNVFNPIDRGLTQLIEGTRNRVKNHVQPWPKGTTLITGSSMLLGVTETRLKRYKAKVRAFPGATVDDMFDYLLPLLKKKPSNIILHIGSNDAPHKLYMEIAKEIECLKDFIRNILPTARVYISCPVIRTDNRKANFTLRCLDKYLKSNSNDIINNDNVDSSCLGKRGLHLNPKGSGRLAINYISLMRCL